MTDVEKRVEQTSGWILFAATLAIVVGAFNIIYGLVFLFQDDLYFLTSEGFVVASFTTWGWILLILGIVQILVGAGLLSGRTIARVLGLLMAILAFIQAFLTFPVYPWWSLFIMLLTGFVVFALAARWEETPA